MESVYASFDSPTEETREFRGYEKPLDTCLEHLLRDMIGASVNTVNIWLEETDLEPDRNLNIAIEPTRHGYVVDLVYREISYERQYEHNYRGSTIFDLGNLSYQDTLSEVRDFVSYFFNPTRNRCD